MWQAWHFLDVAKTLAGVGQNERCFWGSFRVAGAVFGELGQCFEGSKASFSETVVILILDMVMVPCARRIALVVARC